MNKPVIIGFYGFSNSGKTTLISKLINYFSEKGVNVATIKQSNKDYSIDKVGSDTWKHAEAGAKLSCFHTAVETSFIVKKQLEIKEIIHVISEIGSYDLIFVEGARDGCIQKIRLNDTTPLRKQTLLTYDNDINMVIDIIEEKLSKTRKTYE
jgi:molybdopterin-guanine dinucleotide biosynthesis protein B